MEIYLVYIYERRPTVPQIVGTCSKSPKHRYVIFIVMKNYLYVDDSTLTQTVLHYPYLALQKKMPRNRYIKTGHDFDYTYSFFFFFFFFFYFFFFFFFFFRYILFQLRLVYYFIIRRCIHFFFSLFIRFYFLLFRIVSNSYKSEKNRSYSSSSSSTTTTTFFNNTSQLPCTRCNLLVVEIHLALCRKIVYV